MNTEIGEGDDDDPDPAEDTVERVLQCRQPDRPDHRSEDGGVEIKIADEPQMVPVRHGQPVDRAEAEIVANQEIGIALRVAELRHQLDPELRGDDDRDPEGERDEQPERPVAHEPADAARAPQQRAAGIARHDEEQRQPPGIDDEHRQQRPFDERVGFHVIVPRHENHADVIKDEERKRADPEPVHPVMSRHPRQGGGGVRTGDLRVRHQRFIRGIPIKSALADLHALGAQDGVGRRRVKIEIGL